MIPSNEHYRYFIRWNIPRSPNGSRQIFPINTNKFSIVSEKQQGQVFFRRKLNGNPVLTGDDYSFIKTIEAGQLFFNSNTANFYFVIRRECSGVWSDFWIGQFNIFSCKFDDDACKVEIENINVYDKYTCLLSQKETKYNLFNIPDIYTCTSINPTYQIEYTSFVRDYYPVHGQFSGYTYTPFYLGNVLNPITPPYTLIDIATTQPANEYWQVVQNFYTIDYTQLPAVVRLKTTWARLFVITVDVGGNPQPPNNGNWDGGTPITYQGLACHKWINTDFPNNLHNNLPVRTSSVVMGQYVPATEYIWYDWLTTIGQTKTYDRNRTLIDAIEQTLAPCGLTFQSEFFTNHINPITQLASKTNNILIAGKSDIIDPTSTEPQTLGEYTFSDIETWLREMFQVYWDIDTNGNFVCEHINYWKTNQNVSIDATAIDGGKYIKSTNKYGYIEPEQYSRERWSFVDASGLDFKGADIVYYNGYVNVQDDNILEHAVNNVCTDIGYIEISPTTVSKEGFVIMACEYDANGDLIVVNEVGKLSGFLAENGHLSVANLQDTYFKYWRLWPSGLMNNIDTVFYSQKRVKLQEEINFPYCCQILDETKLVKTYMGNGEINGASFDLRSQTLTTTLLY